MVWEEEEFTEFVAKEVDSPSDWTATHSEWEGEETVAARWSISAITRASKNDSYWHWKHIQWLLYAALQRMGLKVCPRSN